MFGKREYSLLMLGLASLGMIVQSSWPKTGTQISFLRVGQGDCTVFQTGDLVMLVDAAPRTDDFDAGERMATPELRRLGVKKIDVLILTHPDSDHVGGMIAIARHFQIGKVLLNKAFQSDEKMLSWLNRAKIPIAKRDWLEGENEFDLGPARVHLLSPPWLPPGDDNEGSLLTHIQVGAGSVVMTGDASSAIEDSLDADPAWGSQIMKAGHHGSKHSTSAAWLEQVAPTWVIVSCGRNNPYHHPHPSTLARIQDYGAKVLRTDRDGTITFHLTKSGFIPDTAARAEP